MAASRTGAEFEKNHAQDAKVLAERFDAGFAVRQLQMSDNLPP